MCVVSTYRLAFCLDVSSMPKAGVGCTCFVCSVATSAVTFLERNELRGKRRWILGGFRHTAGLLAPFSGPFIDREIGTGVFP